MSPSDPEYPRGAHAAGPDEGEQKCKQCRRQKREHPVPCACAEAGKRGVLMMCSMCCACPEFKPLEVT